jgi:Rrf2 family protein
MMKWFMQLTRAADYAVRVMIHLAGLPPGARASRAELAREAECPEQFLSKVLQSLTRAGLVISHRGNTGGFELQEAHTGVSILNVVQAIEGPVRLNLCLTSDARRRVRPMASGPKRKRPCWAFCRAPPSATWQRKWLPEMETARSPTLQNRTGVGIQSE